MASVLTAICSWCTETQTCEQGDQILYRNSCYDKPKWGQCIAKAAKERLWTPQPVKGSLPSEEAPAATGSSASRAWQNLRGCGWPFLNSHNAANTSTIVIISKIWGSSCFCLFLAALHALGARILWERKSKTCIVCCCACTEEIQAYEKVHTVVARSTFPSQNVQSTSAWDHFWKLRCRKSARRCGAKHISKSKCTKHTMLGPLLEVAMSKKRTPLWHEAHFEVNMYKTHHARTTFGSWDVEKLHAVVARSAFRSQNVQNTPCPDHFWKLRCRKSARRCGAKHISKSKCTKHNTIGPLLEVEMSKNCTLLWREAHFEVTMYKTPHVCATFGGSDVVSCGRRKGLCTLSKVSKTWGFCSIFNYNHHYTTLHSNTLHYNYNYNFTTFHYTTLHYTALNYIQLHYTTLHYTTLHSTTLHYTTFHYTSLHYTTLHSTTLQLQLHNYTPLH